MTIALGDELESTHGQPCGTLMVKEDMPPATGAVKVPGKTDRLQLTGELR